MYSCNSLKIYKQNLLSFLRGAKKHILYCIYILLFKIHVSRDAEQKISLTQRYIYSKTECPDLGNISFLFRLQGIYVIIHSRYIKVNRPNRDPIANIYSQ